MNDPGILPSRKVRRRRHKTRKEELFRLQAGGRDPGSDRVPRLLGDLELHRPVRLLLHDNRAWGDMTALEHIANVKPHQVAPAQLAVDGEIEQREFPGLMIQLQSNPDGLDLLQLQRRLLADQLPFVPTPAFRQKRASAAATAGLRWWYTRQRHGGHFGAQQRVGRQHGEVAVTTHARRRHQGSEAAKQPQARPERRSVPARTGIIAPGSCERKICGSPRPVSMPRLRCARLSPKTHRR